MPIKCNQPASATCQNACPERTNKIPPLLLRLILTLGISLAAVACQNNNSQKKPNNPYKKLFKKKGSYTQTRLPYQTLAKVNFETVSTVLFELFLAARKQANPGENENPDVATEALIDLFVLAQKARQEKLDQVMKVREQLRYQRISLLAKIYLNKLKAEITVSEQEMELAHRKRYLERDNHEYKTRHILVKDRKLAIALMRRLLNSENFATLARKYSRGPSASFGGALEWFRPDTVSRKFASAVLRLKKGEISAPVKTRHGWHIILLEDIRKISPPSLKQVYSRLHEDLKQKKIKRHIKKLRALSTIRVNQQIQ